MIESYRRRGIDPYAYLKDVLTRLPSMTNRQTVGLLPANWGQMHIPDLKAAA
ncbi:MAG: transposase domain-containing protein [Verrucomicrobiota bacterium]|nr:transposase domain-containing protein [Verrucomicrobiota bacterium]